MKTGKEIGNVNIPARVKQIFVLVVAILIGMIISVAANANGFNRESLKHNKNLYKKQTVVMAKACHLLKEKRKITTNKVVKENSGLKYR